MNKALAVLRRTFGPQVTALFKRSAVSDWGRNPYARGSYSYVAVGGSGRDYDELSWPVGVGSQRVFFAGEHTSPLFFATVDGAFFSGVQAAQRAACALGLRQPMAHVPAALLRDVWRPECLALFGIGAAAGGGRPDLCEVTFWALYFVCRLENFSAQDEFDMRWLPGAERWAPIR